MNIESIDTANMCSHLKKKLFEEDGVYHHLWIAMRDDPELTAVVRSRQLHIYRNGKKVLILAGKAAPKVIREDRLCEILPKINKWPNSISHNETEETKNQVCCPIFLLLVGLFGLIGWWSPEIPDIGWLFRFICVSGDHVIAPGHSTHTGGIYIHKRITTKQNINKQRNLW